MNERQGLLELIEDVLDYSCASTINALLNEFDYAISSLP